MRSIRSLALVAPLVASSWVWAQPAAAPAPAPSPEPAPSAPVAPPLDKAAPVPGDSIAPKDGDKDKDSGGWAPALFGDPTPLTRRPPTNRMFTLEASLKYGLVGTGPTRFVNDLRFSLLDWLEVRTQVGPVVLPESLMTRISVGRYRTMGRLGLELGVHKFDMGLRLFPEEGEARGLNPNIIPSINGMAALTYDLPIWDRFAMHLSARFQQRFQHSIRKLMEMHFRNPLDQFAGQLTAQGSWDVTKSLGLTVGVAYGQAWDNRAVSDVFTRALRGTLPWEDPQLPRLNVGKATDRRDPATALDMRDQCGENHTRTLFIDFAELARPGYSTLVDREMNCSLSLTGALTYGRTESFDVDLFGNFRMWPQLGGLFGGGVRWRIAP